MANSNKVLQNSKRAGRPSNSSKGSARPLTDREVNQLMNTCYGKHGLRNRAIIALQIHCGMRINEVMALSRLQVVNPNNTIKDSFVITGSNMKGKTTHRYFISSVGKLILGEFLVNTESNDIDGPLFPSPKTNGYMSANAGAQLVRNLMKKAGLDTSSHSGRATFARKLLDNGVGVETISKCLAHKHVQTTISYLGDLRVNAGNAVANINY